MFEKLLSQLPYSPSLVYKMGLYKKQLQKEALLRKMGLVFFALAILVQIYALTSPPITSKQNTQSLSTASQKIETNIIGVKPAAVSANVSAAHTSQTSLIANGSMLVYLVITLPILAISSYLYIRASVFKKESLIAIRENTVK